MADIVCESKICMMRFEELSVGAFFIVSEPGKKDRLYLKTHPVMNPLLKESIKFNCVQINLGYSGFIDKDTIVTQINPTITY